jgi:hypothetical protein
MRRVPQNLCFKLQTVLQLEKMGMNKVGPLFQIKTHPFGPMEFYQCLQERLDQGYVIGSREIDPAHLGPMGKSNVSHINQLVQKIVEVSLLWRMGNRLLVIFRDQCSIFKQLLSNLRMKGRGQLNGQLKDQGYRAKTRQLLWKMEKRWSMQTA